MPRQVRRALCRLLLVICVASLTSLSVALGSGGAPANHHHRAKARLRSQSAQAREALQALQARMASMSAQNSRDALTRERLTDELRSVELSLSHQRAVLQQTQRDLTEQTGRRAALALQRQQKAHELEQARAGLAGELRGAYLLEREGPVQLLLNQKSPLASERLLAYYGYFSRAGAARITRISADVQQLDELDAQIAQQQARLAFLQTRQQAELQQLGASHQQRARVLVGLNMRVQSREQQLSTLQSQQATLERLLEQLRQQALRRQSPSVLPGAPSRGEPAAPLDLASVFGRLHGQLDWPVQGRVAAVYGEQRASGIPWDGVLIDAPRDSPIHAVAGGRVVYADWLPGLGLLMIVDHGGGYLSLYGHNDRLYRAVGASVAAGDVIAAAGDTGGRPTPQLYFEIRHAGRPVDPLPWFRARQPSP